MEARRLGTLALFVLVGAGAVLAGCGRLGARSGSGAACSSVSSADRCQALGFEAATELRVSFDAVRSITIVPNPNPNTDGMPDFGHRTFLEVALADGSLHSIVISCPGIDAAFVPQCMPQPKVPLGMPNGKDSGGYEDTPEDATPFPSIDPATLTARRPLTIAKLVIPITELGRRSIVVGRAALANGRLFEGGFALSDPWPSDVHFAGAITLTVVPLAGGAPLQNIYEHGWHDGVEDVEATLTFDVDWVQPGASITVVNLAVG